MRALLLWFTIAALPAAAAGPVGTWITPEEKSHIEIYRCEDDVLCGRVVHLGEPNGDDGRPRVDGENPDRALRERPILGLEILRIPATPDDRGMWRRGRIYDPESGRTYQCRMWLEGDDVLQFKGYIGISLFGRTSTWRRLPDG